MHPYQHSDQKLFTVCAISKMVYIETHNYPCKCIMVGTCIKKYLKYFVLETFRVIKQTRAYQTQMAPNLPSEYFQQCVKLN